MRKWRKSEKTLVSRNLIMKGKREGRRQRENIRLMRSSSLLVFQIEKTWICFPYEGTELQRCWRHSEKMAGSRAWEDRPAGT